MEKEIQIKTPDKKVIYGTLSSSAKTSKKLVIFVHGFTGHRNEHIFFNGAKFFNKNNFDAFRFDLYSGEKNARLFKDTKISVHGSDITTIIKYFRKKYQKIYVVGHSFGGTSLLLTDWKIIDALVFWDASYINPAKLKDEFIFDKRFNGYVTSWGIEWIVGKEYADELLHFKNCAELVGKIHKPILFITAEKGNLKAGEKYLISTNEPKKLINIKGADHNFNNFKTEDDLLRQTLNWIKKY